MGVTFSLLPTGRSLPADATEDMHPVTKRQLTESVEVAATGGSTVRTIADRAGDIINLKDRGGVGDNSTSNTTALAALRSVGATVYVPDGIYYVPETSFGSIPRRMHGRGQIRMGTTNKRAPFFTLCNAAPSSYGNPDSIDTAFNGDLSTVQFAIEHRITNSGTLTEPTSGYVQKLETSPVVIVGYNSSGYNHDTGGEDGGRTGAALVSIRAQNAGQGDLACITVGGFASGQKSGATSFLANSAVVALNGSFVAGAAGVYMNLIELTANDNGYDAAAVGLVFNLTRSVATAALGENWMGSRMQSRGAQYCDVAYSAFGKWKRMLDTSDMELDSDNAAITLQAGHKIFFASSRGEASPWYSDTLGGVSIGYNSVASAFEMVVGGFAALRVKSGSTPVNGIDVTSAGTGSHPSIAVYGSDTNIDLTLTPKGTGRLRYGTPVSISGETITHYLPWRDAAGNAIKIAVVS